MQKVENNLSDLIEFIIAETWLPKKGIYLDTIIGEDINIAGNDYVEFIDNYSERFGVNVSNFHTVEFTSGDGFILDFVHLIRKIKEERVFNKKKKLSVSHLLEGIKTGVLDSDKIEVT